MFAWGEDEHSKKSTERGKEEPYGTLRRWVGAWKTDYDGGKRRVRDAGEERRLSLMADA